MLGAGVMVCAYCGENPGVGTDNGRPVCAACAALTEDPIEIRMFESEGVQILTTKVQ